MSDSSLHPASSEPDAPQHEGKPPRIPIERHVVASVQALERLKANAEQVLFLMRFSNFDDPAIVPHIQTIRQGAEDLAWSYTAYLEIIECEGQA